MIITKEENQICPFCDETIDPSLIRVALENRHGISVIICSNEKPYPKHVWCRIQSSCKQCRKREECKYFIRVEPYSPLTIVAERYKK